MHSTDAKVAILVDNYFEQAEFEHPLERLKADGSQVAVIGTKTKDLQAMHHAELGGAFMADVLIDNVSADDFDVLLLPGGVMNADKLRMNTSARAWVAQFMDQGKLVAAICHAPWLLISADLVEGRRLTSYYTLQDDVRNAGGEWIDQPVVIDNDLITSRHPDDIPLFMDAIKTWLGGVPQSDGEE
jgi:protease I